jgi:hypothetical protein
MSMRTMLAGREPSAFALGTVNPISIVDPRRSAVTTGGAGVSTSGGSGGPFCPQAEHAEMTITTEIAENAEKTNLPGDLCVVRRVRRAITGCSATGLRS